LTAWQETKLRARQAVHDTFAGSVAFFATKGASRPPNVNVRVHDKKKMVGDLAGTNLSYAEFSERPTEVVFLVAEMVGLGLSRGSLIFGYDYTGAIFGFYIDSVDPEDGLTQTAKVSPLDLSDHSGTLLPDGSQVP